MVLPAHGMHKSCSLEATAAATNTSPARMMHHGLPLQTVCSLWAWMQILVDRINIAITMDTPLPAGLMHHGLQIQTVCPLRACIPYCCDINISTPATSAPLADGGVLPAAARSPGPGHHSCWTVLSTPSWARDMLNSDAQKTRESNTSEGPKQVPKYAFALLAEFQALLQKLLQKELPQPVYLDAQRWGSAFKSEPLDAPHLLDEDLRLAGCWYFCKESSGRGAMESGLSAAAGVHAMLTASSG